LLWEKRKKNKPFSLLSYKVDIGDIGEAEHSKKTNQFKNMIDLWTAKLFKRRQN